MKVVKFLANEKKLSLIEISNIIGTTEKSLFVTFNNEYAPSMRRLVDFANALELKPSELIQIWEESYYDSKKWRENTDEQQ